MNEPPRKRRRTSSLAPASTPGDDTLQRAADFNSPLKQPPRRRSFTSPTKASLARFNPNLLQQQPSYQDERTTEEEKQGTRAGEIRRETVEGEERSEAEAAPRAQQEGAVKAKTPSHLALPRRPKPNASARRSLHLPLLREEDESDLGPASSPSAMLPEERRPGVLFSSPIKPPRKKARADSSTLEFARPETRKRRSPSAVAGAEVKGRHGTPESRRKKQQLEPDPVLEAKEREKEALLRELHGLEDDVERATQKLQKLQDPKTPEILNVFERDQIMYACLKLMANTLEITTDIARSLLTKLTRPADAPPEPEQAPISNLLNSFLPFTVSAIAPPNPAEQEEEYIPSHKPLQLEDPLPYLSFFTPFKFESTISIPSISNREDTNPDANPLHQKHIISIAGPQKLFAAKLDMIVDTETHTVVSLSVPVLSYWAERELGTFIQRKAEEKDLGCVTWAMSSYWMLAVKRAGCWHKCASAHPELVPAHKSSERGPANTGGMSRKDMLSWLGKDELVLENQHVRLKVTWGIGFDWTGEAESTVGVEYAVPSICESLNLPAACE